MSIQSYALVSHKKFSKTKEITSFQAIFDIQPKCLKENNPDLES